MGTSKTQFDTPVQCNFQWQWIADLAPADSVATRTVRDTFADRQLNVVPLVYLLRHLLYLLRASVLKDSVLDESTMDVGMGMPAVIPPPVF